jgi:hypothetical protein
MKNIWRQHKKLPPDQNLMAEKFLFFDCLLDGEQFNFYCDSPFFMQLVGVEPTRVLPH